MPGRKTAPVVWNSKVVLMITTRAFWPSMTSSGTSAFFVTWLRRVFRCLMISVGPMKEIVVVM
jgi:hypothetical protein